MSSANPSSVKVRVIFVLVVTDGTRKGVSAELITLVSYLTDDDMLVVEKCMPNFDYQLGRLRLRLHLETDSQEFVKLWEAEANQMSRITSIIWEARVL